MKGEWVEKGIIATLEYFRTHRYNASTHELIFTYVEKVYWLQSGLYIKIYR